MVYTFLLFQTMNAPPSQNPVHGMITPQQHHQMMMQQQQMYQQRQIDPSMVQQSQQNVPMGKPHRHYTVS